MKGHHAYKDTWTLEIGDSHNAQIETNNPVDKYAVCIRKSGKVVGHLKKGENGKLQKQYSFSWGVILIRRQKQEHPGADAILVLVKVCGFLAN